MNYNTLEVDKIPYISESCRKYKVKCFLPSTQITVIRFVDSNKKSMYLRQMSYKSDNKESCIFKVYIVS